MPRKNEEKSEKKNGHAKEKKPAKAPREKKLTDFIQRLPVALTDAELLAFGQRLAKCQADLTEHNMHAEQVKKELKAKESAIEAERAHLSGIIREKKELRDVQCERWAHYDEGDIVELRTDTGEVIYQRRMEMHERQVSLPIPKGDGPAPAGTSEPLRVNANDAQDIASKHTHRGGPGVIGTVPLSAEEAAEAMAHNPDEPPAEATT
jgi:hypothetical protein